MKKQSQSIEVSGAQPPTSRLDATPKPESKLPISADEARPNPSPVRVGLGLAATLEAAVAQIGLGETQDSAMLPQSGQSAMIGAGTPASLQPVSVPGAIPSPLASWERYQIMRPLGEGAMGMVFLARDRRLGRQVALKFLRLPSPDAAERMMQEARAQARLDHAGICKVFEVGDFQGQPYIVMEYLQGQPLESSLHRLSLEQKIMLLHQLAQAVHAAHVQGVLHRDLKPANVMVCTTHTQGAREFLGELRPVLMDFGLARDALGAQRLTQTGMVMGTPHYMAPEQAAGNARHLDRRADVYSLGAMLYEMLTGRPPFDAKTEVEQLLAVLHQDPRPPRQLDRSIPVSLEIIALKCLRKEPERRYESALALAEDLRRYLNGEPIFGRPASTLYRLQRLLRNYRTAVAVSTVLLCSLGALSGMAIHGRFVEREATRRAEGQRLLAGKLGQDVAWMNQFLRIAYSLPVHDLTREQKVVRERLSELETQLTGVDSFLRSTMEGAIGQGYLALRQYEPAVAHLQSSLQLGETGADVHLALGQAWGQLYDREADDVVRRLQGEPAARELERLRRKYLVPGRVELALGKTSRQTDPRYIRALIHYYAGKAEYDQALQDAVAAKQAAPWLLEPIELEVRIISQRYLEQLDRGDPCAGNQLGVVQAAIEHATNAARSNPEFYNRFAKVMTFSVRSAILLNLDGKEWEALYVDAIAQARLALLLLPDDTEAYDQLAELLARWADWQKFNRLDPRANVEEALATANKALAKKAERARPYYARGLAYQALAEYQKSIDEDAESSYAQAVTDFRHATALEPDNQDAWHLRGIALQMLAGFKEWRDLPVDEEYAEAEQAYKRSIALRPEQTRSMENLGHLYTERVDHSIQHGTDPSADFARANQIRAELLAKEPKSQAAESMGQNLHWSEVDHLLNTGQDAVAAAKELVVRAQRTRREHPKFEWLVEPEALAYSVLGDALMRQRLSPISTLQQGLTVLPRTGAGRISEESLMRLRCELWLRQAAWSLANKRSPEPAVQACLQNSAGFTQAKGETRTTLTALRAKALRLRGHWMFQQHQVPAALAAVNAGLAACTKLRNTARGGLLPCKIEEAVLTALKAQLVQSPVERVALAESASTELQSLLEKRPPLGYELASHLKASVKLANFHAKSR